MTENRQRTAVGVSLLFVYASIFATGMWRALRGKGGAAGVPELFPKAPLPFLARSKPELAAPAEETKQLEDLSLDTPGDAPLDRLARRAALEEREAVLIRPGGGVDDPKSPLPQGPSQPWTHSSENVADLLARQSLESPRLTGWSLPMPDRLPVPTYAPAVMALGIVIFAMGLATIWYVCVIGAVVFAVAAWRWAGELQGE
jgi:hypothetical protein